MTTVDLALDFLKQYGKEKEGLSQFGEMERIVEEFGGKIEFGHLEDEINPHSLVIRRPRDFTINLVPWHFMISRWQLAQNFSRYYLQYYLTGLRTEEKYWRYEDSLQYKLANLFAAEILMPKELFESKHMMGVHVCAGYFHLPLFAITERANYFKTKI